MLDPKMTIQETAIIEKGESESTVILKSGYKNMLIIMPAAWTAADITFLVSNNPKTGFVKLVKASDESEITSKASASEAVNLDGTLKEALGACAYVKIRSGTSTTPVNQVDRRTLIVVLSR